MKYPFTRKLRLVTKGLHYKEGKLIEEDFKMAIYHLNELEAILKRTLEVKDGE